MGTNYDGPVGTVYVDGVPVENAGALEIRMECAQPLETIERESMRAGDRAQVKALMDTAMNYANEGGK